MSLSIETVMKYPTRFGENVFKELKDKASKSSPDISGTVSKLFVLPDFPLAGIQLTIPVEEYLKLTRDADDAVRANPIDVVPTGNEDFPIMVNTQVDVIDGRTFIGDREVALVF